MTSDAITARRNAAIERFGAFANESVGDLVPLEAA